jgi:phospholipase/lecithinase/hemolysin
LDVLCGAYAFREGERTMRMNHLAVLVVGVLTGVLAPVAAGAGPSNVFVFGDSLSDTGTLAEALGHNAPNPPSFHDSFTNGPVAVELLAERFGLRADPSLWLTGFTDASHLFPSGFVAGTNYAVGGATAAGGTTGLPNQVGAFLSHVGQHAPSDALYLVMIGGNDVRTAAHAGASAGVIAGVNSELAMIQLLISKGATHLLIPNVPNVGAIPEFTQDSPAGQAATATAFSILYDQLLASGIQSLISQNPTDSILSFDLFGFNSAIGANASNLGFTNATDRCYTNAVTVFVNPAVPLQDTAACGVINPVLGAANIDHFLYWDNIHPTSRVQAMWAEGFAAIVPEPATLTLFGLGLTLCFIVRRGGGIGHGRVGTRGRVHRGRRM